MLEKVAQVRNAAALEQAENSAAHEVTGCFNTVLAAALEMQGFLDSQAEALKKKNKKKKHVGGGGGAVEEKYESMSDQKRHICFEMLTEAQDDFIFLQKTRDGRSLQINPFLVRIMLENAAR